ncbi:uncharacterized protein LOC130939857 [Arachis stenosperma]|uniref:uncharacterized protein LOC130939857 n=1 Tax=Arachis stenosperma TaxID=217475 RepID=UPI0025AC589E|nr:uncharacterized protein LOC130939857 [Arachis stenosperma]
MVKEERVHRTLVFLVLCVLFRLTCKLQRLRFEGVHKIFEGCGSDASLIFGEHVRIRKQLWLTSHRYRFFIIGCLVTITVSQLGALLLVLASKSDKTFFNFGDLLVCSAVQLSGFMLCLVGAARITHRAQGIVAIATRWHLLITEHAIYTIMTYLQHNKGGITLYGFTLDRGLLHTLFAFELSLVLWILSKVVVLS